LRPIKAGERSSASKAYRRPQRPTSRESHKIALKDIAVGQSIVKYGEPIGEAKIEIKAGDWIHIHNIKTEAR